MKSIRMLIADDHTIVRNGLHSIFEGEEGFEIISEARDGLELVEKALDLKPDVILSDLKMPIMTGIEAAKNIKSADASIKIIILTVFDECHDVQEAVQAGVEGYMLKNTLPDELIHAVELVCKGYTCIFHPSDNSIQDRYDHQSLPEIKDINGLTEREMDVYRLIARNYSNLEIAGQLFISEATVKSHVSRILRKTGQSNRAQAVLYGLSKGIINSKEMKK